MYNGLTTADKGALMDAKARGAKFVAREANGDLWAYKEKPEKDHNIKFWSSNGNRYLDCDNATMKFVKWGNREPVNIDLALAQIAEMESTEMESVEKPMTVNEWINQASVEEKAKWLSERGYCPENFFDCSMHEDCKACWKVVLNSPYTEGETDEG